MSTDHHILPLIDAYLAGGLDDAERKSFDAHVAGCRDCAAALESACVAGDRLTEAFAAALPLAGLEDRLVGALRPRMSRPSFADRLSRPIRHPAVRKIAVGLAASLVIGTVGYGMTVAVDRQQGGRGEDRERVLAMYVPSSGAGEANELSLERLSAESSSSGQKLAENVEFEFRKATNEAASALARGEKRRAEEELNRARETVAKNSGLLTDNQASLYNEKLRQLSDTAGGKVLESEQLSRDLSRADKAGRGTTNDSDQDGIRRYSTDWPDVASNDRNSANFFANAVPGSAKAPDPVPADTTLGVPVTMDMQAGRVLALGEKNFADAPDFNLQGGSGGGGGGGAGSGAGLFGAAKSAGSTEQSARERTKAVTTAGERVSGSPEALAGQGPKATADVAEGYVDRLAELDGKAVAAGGDSARGWAEGTTYRWFKPGDGSKASESKLSSPAIELTDVEGVARVPDGGTLLLGGQVVNGELAKLQKGEKDTTSLAYKAGAASSPDAVDSFGVVDPMSRTRSDASGKQPPTSGEAQLGKELSGQQAPGQQSSGQSQSGGSQSGEQGGGQQANNPQPSNQDGTSAAGRTNDGPTALAQAPAPGGQSSPNPTTPPPSAGTSAVPQAPVPPPQQVRKVIRNGTVTFEVDSFDSALVQVTKLAAEEGGFVQTTSSDKLPNGKVRGAVTVRVPPDRLDTLVLKLRGMGDLKNQRISAEDVTKRYTDVESQLRAARAMEERLLAIIKTGGEVKDLLEAEKQLGVWREKLEILQGEIKYYDNLISLSTLIVELMERDVRTPTAAFEVETVSSAVESEEVENTRAEILKAIEQAKGRVIDSDLKKLEAGQLSATIKATVAPDAAGPVIDRLKQLGKVARLDISRKTATQGGTGPIVPGLRVEKRETQLDIHIYNLANIEPRQVTSLVLAAQDVEASYKQIMDQVKSAGGNVKSSQLNRPRADQMSGTIVFQVPADKADVVLGAIRAGVDVMRMDVATNTDTQNTTEAKRGISVQISSLSHVPARETTTLQVAAADVPASFRRLLDAATGAGGRVLTSQLNEQDVNNISAQLEFETPRDKWSGVEQALREAGAVVSRSTVRSNDTENTVDSKVRLSVAFMDEIRLSPRETINATVATRTVQETFDKLVTSAKGAGARVVGSNLNLADRARPTGSIRFAVARESADRFEQSLKEAGLTTSRAVARLPDGPMTVESKVGFVITVVDERTLTARETQSMTVVASGVSDRYYKVLEALVAADALVINSQLSTQNAKETTGTLEFVINRQDRQRIEDALGQNADIFNRAVERSADTQGTVDTKVRYAVTIRDADQQPPRQVVQMTLQTAAVDKAVGDLEAAAIAAGGRKLEAERFRQDRRDGARIVVDVPLAKVGELVTAVRGQGEVTANQSRQNDGVPQGALSRARVEIAYAVPPTAAADKGFGESIREGLSGALTGLFTVLRWVIFGLVVIVPCLVLIWLAYQLTRLVRPRRTTTEPSTGVAT